MPLSDASRRARSAPDHGTRSRSTACTVPRGARAAKRGTKLSRSSMIEAHARRWWSGAASLATARHAEAAVGRHRRDELGRRQHGRHRLRWRRRRAAQPDGFIVVLTSSTPALLRRQWSRRTDAFFWVDCIATTLSAAPGPTPPREVMGPMTARPGRGELVAHACARLRARLSTPPATIVMATSSYASYDADVDVADRTASVATRPNIGAGVLRHDDVHGARAFGSCRSSAIKYAETLAKLGAGGCNLDQVL